MNILKEVVGSRIMGVVVQEKRERPRSLVYLVFEDCYLELYTTGPELIHAAKHLRSLDWLPWEAEDRVLKTVSSFWASDTGPGSGS